MKLTAFVLGVLMLLPAVAHADEFTYGNCKKIPDKYDAGFYRCISSNGQLVYTNVIPSADEEAKFKRDYRKWLLRKKHPIKLKPVVIRGEVPPKEQCEPLVVHVRDPEPLPQDACSIEKESVRKLEDRWGELALKWTGTRGDVVDKEMDQIERSIGITVGDVCNPS